MNLLLLAVLLVNLWVVGVACWHAYVLEHSED